MNVEIALDEETRTRTRTPLPPSSSSLDDDVPSTSRAAAAAALLSAAVAAAAASAAVSAAAAAAQASDEAATSSIWDFNALEVCRNCGKVNAELYDLFTSAAANADAVVDLDHDDEEEAAAARRDANVNAAATSPQQLRRPQPHFNISCSDANITLSAANAVGGGGGLPQSGDMAGILEEMQIWQLKIKPNDGLPQRICLKCFKQYSLIHKFRRRCLKVQVRLQALYEERRLEEQQQQQQQQLHNKNDTTVTVTARAKTTTATATTTTTPLHLPPVLDISNDLINDNYGQPLSEVELFETAWNASDAPLLDSDASKTEITVEVVRGTDDEDDDDDENDRDEDVENDEEVGSNVAAIELEVAAQVGSELDAARCLNDSMDLTVKSNIDEESLLDAHIIFKPADADKELVVAITTAQSEAPEKIMQSEEESSLDKSSDQLHKPEESDGTAAAAADETVETKHSFFEDNAVDIVLQQNDEIEFVSAAIASSEEIPKSKDVDLILLLEEDQRVVVNEKLPLSLPAQITDETSLLCKANSDSVILAELVKNKDEAESSSAAGLEDQAEAAANTNINTPQKELPPGSDGNDKCETPITEDAKEVQKTAVVIGPAAAAASTLHTKADAAKTKGETDPKAATEELENAESAIAKSIPEFSTAADIALPAEVEENKIEEKSEQIEVTIAEERTEEETKCSNECTTQIKTQMPEITVDDRTDESVRKTTESPEIQFVTKAALKEYAATPLKSTSPNRSAAATAVNENTPNQSKNYKNEQPLIANLVCSNTTSDGAVDNPQLAKQLEVIIATSSVAMTDDDNDNTICKTLISSTNPPLPTSCENVKQHGNSNQKTKTEVIATSTPIAAAPGIARKRRKKLLFKPKGSKFKCSDKKKKRVGNVLLSGRRTPQLQACYVRLRRLRVDNTNNDYILRLSETEVALALAESSPITTRDNESKFDAATATVGTAAAATIGHDLNIKTCNEKPPPFENKARMVEQSEKNRDNKEGGNTKAIRKRKYVTPESETMRKSPWKTKAEMKANVEHEIKRKSMSSASSALSKTTLCNTRSKTESDSTTWLGEDECLAQDYIVISNKNKQAAAVEEKKNSESEIIASDLVGKETTISTMPGYDASTPKELKLVIKRKGRSSTKSKREVHDKRTSSSPTKKTKREEDQKGKEISSETPKSVTKTKRERVSPELRAKRIRRSLRQETRREKTNLQNMNVAKDRETASEIAIVPTQDSATNEVQENIDDAAAVAAAVTSNINAEEESILLRTDQSQDAENTATNSSLSEMVAAENPSQNNDLPNEDLNAQSTTTNAQTPQQTTNIVISNNNINIKTSTDVSKENCDNDKIASTTEAAAMLTQSEQQQLNTTINNNESQTSELPKPIIVRIQLSSLTEEFQRIHLKQAKTTEEPETTTSTPADDSAAVAAVSDVAAASQSSESITPTESGTAAAESSLLSTISPSLLLSSSPEENFCISAAADCSDAAGALNATADRAAPPAAQPYVIITSPTQTITTTAAADNELALESTQINTEMLLNSSQYDSEEHSDFNGFTGESDISDNLNTSVESIESQTESIQGERASDLQQEFYHSPNSSGGGNAYSKINDFINEFQTHCLDASEFEEEAQEESTTILEPCQYQALLPVDQHLTSAVELSDIALATDTNTAPLLLSASNLSEMNDVETTLNGILNEMQDQHIYTPVSSHTDDFFNQSVYSPLSEEPPESTPTHSLYAESPGGGVAGYISVESSPYVHHNNNSSSNNNNNPLQHQQLEIDGGQFPNFPNVYAGDCFTEDSTQSELIGFQNDIPCFENIELAAAAAAAAAAATSSASNTPTRYAQTQRATTIQVAATTATLTATSTAAAINSNSALQGALPAAKTIADAAAVAATSSSSSNVQFLDSANVSAALGDVLGLVCTSGNAVQMQSTDFTAAASVTDLATSVCSTTSTQYARDKATIHINQLLSEMQQQQQQQQQQLVLQVSNESVGAAAGTTTAFIRNNQLLNPAASATILQRHAQNQTFFTKINQRPLATTSTTTTTMHEDMIGGSKVQFITLASGSGAGANLQQHQTTSDVIVASSGCGSSGIVGGSGGITNINTTQLNTMNLYASNPTVPTQEMQWTSTAGASASAVTVAAAATDAADQTTTTTYYINAADLYQSDLITSTHVAAGGAGLGTLTTLTNVNVSTQQQQQPQQQMLLQQQQQPHQQQQLQLQQQSERLLDKHHSMDANENYIEGMQNQPVMIIIPHEYIRDAGTPVTSANAAQVFTTTHQQELGTFTLTQTTTQPQTVLVQTSNNNNSNSNNNNHNHNSSSPGNSSSGGSPSNITTHFIATPVSSPQRPMATSSPLQQQVQTLSEQIKVNLTCRFCHKRPKFTNNLDYSNHIIATHPAENPFNCPHCPMHFTKRVKRQQHIVEEHGAHRFQCAQCGQSFCAQRTLDLHLQRYHALESPPQQQQQQQQHQQQQRYVRQHVSRTASATWQQQQHDQSSPLVRVEDVHLHVSEVEGKGKRAIDLELDGSHVSTEPSTSTQAANKPQRILCCPDCDESFDDATNPEGHTHSHGHSHAHTHTQQQQQQQQQQQHHAHVTMPSPEQTEPDSTSTTTLRHFRKRRVSATKMAAAAAAVAAANAGNNTAAAADQLVAERVLRSSHNCLFCEERYTNEIALRKHHQLAHGNQASMPFVCSICKRGFRMRTALQRHMETHDAEGRPYECSWCHVRFPRPSQLTLHKLTVHFLKKPHSCEECGKQFGTESALKTHIKFHREPSIQCDLCSRKFFLQKDLRKHRRIHTGERFYKCDICPSSFLHYTRLRAHTKTHIPLGMYLEETSPILQTTTADADAAAEQRDAEADVELEEEHLVEEEDEELELEEDLVEFDEEEEEVEAEQQQQQQQPQQQQHETPQAVVATVDSPKL